MDFLKFSDRLASQHLIINLRGEGDTHFFVQPPVLWDNMLKGIYVFLHELEVSPPTDFHLLELRDGGSELSAGIGGQSFARSEVVLSEDLSFGEQFHIIVEQLKIIFLLVFHI